MHTSARDGIISLLDKPGKDHLNVNNWRPLSLLNTDNKIYAKILANRLDKVVPYLIINEQVGFVKNRSIADNLLDLFSIIQHCELEKIPVILISLDIFKAFDSVYIPSIFSIMNLYNFGPNFISMLKLCFEQNRSAVINNGAWSAWIPIQAGVRQGCVVSPKIFLLVIQILALKIIQNDSIQGITIDKKVKKLGLCADDMWNVIHFNEDSFIELLHKYSEFEDYFGLSINYDKTEILRIGSLHNSDVAFYSTLPLKWSDGPIKILGVSVHPVYNLLVKMNYNFMLEKVENLLNEWATRQLTPIGRICVVNSLVVSKFVYKFQSLPSPSKDFFAKIRKMICSFIWNNKKAKIAYSRLIMDYN